MTAQQLVRCRTCTSDDLHLVFDPGPHRGSTHFVRPVQSVPSAAADPWIFCQSCGTLQTDVTSVPASVFHSLHSFDRYSPSTAKNCDVLAARLSLRFGLGRDDLVLDVGSNDGTLLRAFRDRGMNVLGVEPGARHMAYAYEDGIETIGGQFGSVMAPYLRRRSGPARLIISRFTLGILPDIPAFLRAIADTLAPLGSAVFQVRHTHRLFRELGGEMIHRANPCAFSLRGLERIAPGCGLTWINAEAGPAGTASLFLTASRLDEGARARMGLMAWNRIEGATPQNPGTWRGFRARWQLACEEVRQELVQITRNGAKVIGYPASMDALTFLHALQLPPRVIRAVVDPSAGDCERVTTSDRRLVVSTESPRAVADVVLLLDRGRVEDAILWVARRPGMRLMNPFTRFSFDGYLRDERRLAG